MRITKAAWFASALSAPFCPLACSMNDSGIMGSGDDDSTATLNGGGSSGITPAGCGNGELTADEACDDGNKTDGDGCAANCLSVELGFTCPTPGQACMPMARCGDGIIVAPEQCDDGNKAAGDGCSAVCKYEAGWKCDTSTPSICTTTTCGDGVTEGAENCEDGNALPFDGCSSLCQIEPDCSAGACTSSCGDGVAVGEACDDGNSNNGDGCSSNCTVEDGFVCDAATVATSMNVPAVFRDFLEAHVDFEPAATGQSEGATGLVGSTLDAEGKPVFVAAAGTKWITSATTFAEWYRDVPGTNSTTTGYITLWNKNDGTGAFVNRYYADGSQFQKTEPIYYCGSVADARTDDTGAAIPCTNKYGTTECETAETAGTLLKCYDDNGTYKGVKLVANVDGNPLFFPVDGDSFTPDSERAQAKIAPMYGSDSWLTEAETLSLTTAPLHNFHFTSEVRYWFQYDATTSATLDFTGDDDVWVFINRTLAVDIGGIHTPVNGAVTIDSTSASTFGLEDGKVYEIELFQAERQKDASTYKLTLSGFNAGASYCHAVCGDGIIGVGEECDDGINDGGYGECGAGCVLDTFCGDGILQEGEDCDDGNNVDGDDCGSGCRNVVIY